MLREDIWLINLKPKEVNKYFKASPWREILRTCCKCTNFFPMSFEQILNQFLWYNDNIRINGKCICYCKLYLLGCRNVKDLFDSNYKVLSYDDFDKQFPNSLTWLEYYGLLNSIPPRWISIIKQQIWSTETYQPLYYTLENTKTSVVKIIYSRLIDHPLAVMDAYNRWNEAIGGALEMQKFIESFSHLYKITISTKLRDFQCRLLHKKFQATRSYVSGAKNNLTYVPFVMRKTMYSICFSRVN